MIRFFQQHRRQRRKIVIPRTDDGLFYVAASPEWSISATEGKMITLCGKYNVRSALQIRKATMDTIREFNSRMGNLAGFRAEWRPEIMAVVASEFQPDLPYTRMRLYALELCAARLKAGHYR
jgi:hypothetical protein